MMTNKNRFFSEEEIMLELYDRVVHGSPSGVQFANAVVEFLKELTPVDAVEVVRCKNCEFFKDTWTTDDGKIYGFCPHLSIEHSEMCYCSYGERKEVES